MAGFLCDNVQRLKWKSKRLVTAVCPVSSPRRCGSEAVFLYSGKLQLLRETDFSTGPAT